MEDATHPGSGRAPFTTAHASASSWSRVGASLGRYVVLDEIRRTALGRVLRAYDPRLQREVALECVDVSALGRTGARRLVAEARAMAKLTHPDVLAVYDVEEIDEALVVLVTEHVGDRTLTTWLQRDRSWRDVVAQFRAAARGLAAAHAAGVLHRGFTTDHVLVGTDGRVRVTGFGAVPEPTGDARQDAASDCRSFCLALRTALERTQSPPAALLEAVGRGLSDDPRIRWRSMDALLAALAHDPNRRRRRTLHAAAVVGVLAVSGLEIHAWASAQAERCTQQSAAAHLHGAWDDELRAQAHDAALGVDAPYAARTWTQTEQTLDAYAQTWTRMHVDVCEATTVRGEQPTAVMDLRMACLHRARVDLSAVTHVLAEADAQTVQKAHELTAGLRPLARCADVDALQADVEPPLPAEADAVDAIRARLATARAAGRAGRYAEAEQAIVDASARAADVGYGPVDTELAIVRGLLLDHMGDYDRSHESLREGLRLASRWRQWDEMQLAASTLVYVVGYRRQQFDEGVSYVDLARGLAGADPERQARVSSSLAIVLAARGRHDEAEAELRRALELREQALGPEHLDIAMTHNNLANVLTARGDHAAAEAEHRRALELRERVLGPDHPDVAMSRNNLAAVLHAQGEYEAAEAEHRRVLALREAVLGPDHPDIAQSRNNLGVALEAQGRLDEALVEHRLALDLRTALLGAHHPLVAMSHQNIGDVMFELGRLDEAEAEHRRALAIWESALGPDHPSVGKARTSLERVLVARDEASRGPAP